MDSFVISHIELKNDTLGVTYNLTNNRFEGNINQFESMYFTREKLVECINVATNNSIFLNVFQPKITIAFDNNKKMTIKLIIKVLPPLIMKDEEHIFTLTTLETVDKELPIAGHIQITKEQKIIKLDFMIEGKFKRVTVIEDGIPVAVLENVNLGLGIKKFVIDNIIVTGEIGKITIHDYDFDFIKDFVDPSNIHTEILFNEIDVFSYTELGHKFITGSRDEFKFEYIEKIVNSYLKNKDIFLDSIVYTGDHNPAVYDSYVQIHSTDNQLTYATILLFTIPHLVPNRRKFHIVNQFTKFLTMRKPGKNYVILPKVDPYITIIEELQ